jgi:phytoene dehydrogenase-like protein
MRQTNVNQTTANIIIVGGGLAGLTAATMLARAGRSVILFEKAQQTGGRAVTQSRRGILFNLGAHALYQNGAAVRVLKELGIGFSGGVPGTSSYNLLHNDELGPFPDGVLSLLKSPFLSGRDKLDALRLFMALSTARPSAYPHLTFSEWVAERTQRPAVQRLLTTMARLITYIHDGDQVSADAVLAQFRLILPGNVYYLNGGWQTLVDGLRKAAVAAGVTIQTGVRVARVIHNGRVQGIELTNGVFFPANAVLLATGPAQAASLIGNPASPLPQWVDTAVPVKAATLDIALRRLPRPETIFALSLDRPLYFSVHSAYAKLAPADEVVVHAMKYLPVGRPTDPETDQMELENMMDRLQPGWRHEVIECRYLPNLTVMPALPTAVTGGLPGRPDTAVSHINGLYLAGDWVGPEGLLADATFASASRAAEQILVASRQSLVVSR